MRWAGIERRGGRAGGTESNTVTVTAEGLPDYKLHGCAMHAKTE